MGFVVSALAGAKEIPQIYRKTKKIRIKPL